MDSLNRNQFLKTASPFGIRLKKMTSPHVTEQQNVITLKVQLGKNMDTNCKNEG